ncbi:MAG: hypothetical protein FWG77_04920 [Treponema sp.]|nr:hypothetical protein [Treponema sp.]
MKQFGNMGLIHENGSVNKQGGQRASSKGHRTAQTESPSNTTGIEARITCLFLPWLIEDIPDVIWQTLQKNLGCIIKEVVSTRGKGSQ